MKKKASKKEKKRLLLISLAIISLLTILVSSVYNEWILILKNQNEIKELDLKYENLLENEDKLKSEMVKLQDKEYLARYAKEKYMLSGEGDIIIKTK